jgi:hypothetical protein
MEAFSLCFSGLILDSKDLELMQEVRARHCPCLPAITKRFSKTRAASFVLAAR